MDFAPRDKFSILDGFILHAMISQAGIIGSPHSNSVSRRRDTEGSSSESLRASPPVDGAAATPTPFNLDACFKIGDGS